MKPICDIEEQASVRLRSIENRARTAPSSIVTQPSAKMHAPQTGSPRKRLQEIARMPQTPDFVSAPESRAEAGAGATGCAFGSQMWIGNMPAFAPKPKRMQPPAV